MGPGHLLLFGKARARPKARQRQPNIYGQPFFSKNVKFLNTNANNSYRNREIKIKMLDFQRNCEILFCKIFPLYGRTIFQEFRVVPSTRTAKTTEQLRKQGYKENIS